MVSFELIRAELISFPSPAGVVPQAAASSLRALVSSSQKRNANTCLSAVRIKYREASHPAPGMQETTVRVFISGISGRCGRMAARETAPCHGGDHPPGRVSFMRAMWLQRLARDRIHTNHRKNEESGAGERGAGRSRTKGWRLVCKARMQLGRRLLGAQKPLQLKTPEEIHIKQLLNMLFSAGCCQNTDQSGSCVCGTSPAQAWRWPLNTRLYLSPMTMLDVQDAVIPVTPRKWAQTGECLAQGHQQEEEELGCHTQAASSKVPALNDCTVVSQTTAALEDRDRISLQSKRQICSNFYRRFWLLCCNLSPYVLTLPRASSCHLVGNDSEETSTIANTWYCCCCD
uniref:uncharacterized protein LOC103790867 isoform X2 n=1 Tax=Callithrix jacchus TaxID=9483 RepID=UPI00159D558E|nr:uncharacterized protein LOC103790867 isoform X2 [Callithrix jacchus]